MKSRMERWAPYRAAIDRHIFLEQTVGKSSIKLDVLQKRLHAAFPIYRSKYPSKINFSAMTTKEVGNAPVEDFADLERVLEIFDDLEQRVSFNFDNLDKINFSSWSELDGFRKRLVLGTSETGPVDRKKREVISKIEVEPTRFVHLEGGEKTVINKISIAIDGPSGTGKSTVAKMIAEKYHLNYINTGLIYRTIALHALRTHFDVAKATPATISQLLEAIKIDLRPREIVFLNGRDVSAMLKNNEVSQTASKLAAIAEVRLFARKILQTYAKMPGVIMDGRDTTFSIMPNADIKIFIDSSAATRARRRFLQNQELGIAGDYETVLKETEERDERDRNRAIDPLQVVPGAHYIDTSNLTLDEVIAKVTELIVAWAKDQNERIAP